MRIVKIEKDGCMPCKKMEGILSKLAVTFERKNISQMSQDELEELTNKYEITTCPTLLKINEDGSYTKLNGVNHTMDEFRNFVAGGVVENNTTEVGCANGNCAV